nr:cysteine--tRNA ligase [Fusobacteriaceae bacterium]
FFLLREVLAKFPGNVVRFFVLSSHYRKPIDFSEDELKQAEAGLRRIENALSRAVEMLNKSENTVEAGDSLAELKEALKKSKEKFIEGMDDDFNTAIGVGAVFELVKELNKALEIGSINKAGVEIITETVKFIKEAVEDVLGIKTSEVKQADNLTTELVEFVLKLRRDARDEKNWALSDKIRDGLQGIGIKIKDGKDTTQWSI